MQDEKIIQKILKETEEEVQFLEDRLKKTINETPQYTNKIADLSLRLSIVTEKERILSWVLRG